jgi:hypothetical protein
VSPTTHRVFAQHPDRSHKGRGSAKLEAGKRADQLLAEGDVEGQRVWRRIIRAVEELQRAERRDGEAVN